VALGAVVLDKLLPGTRRQLDRPSATSTLGLSWRRNNQTKNCHRNQN